MERYMPVLEPKQVCEIVTVEDDTDFITYKKSNPTGLVMLPEQYGESKQLVLKSDAGDFAKWLKTNASTIKVKVGKADQRLVLRSGDYWLPLVFLASDVALPIYLNLVANYLYEKMKGALKGETACVHLSAVYEDKTTGVVKRFNFEGDAEALQKAIKRFDLNQFLDE